MLSRHSGNCKFPHGHSRKVEMVFAAESLDDHDMVMDFKAVKDMMQEFINRFDHSICVNTDDPMYGVLKEAYGDRVIGFVSVDPTSEVMAKTVFDYVQNKLEHIKMQGGTWPVRAVVKLERVRVWETSSSWAEYEE